MRIVLLTTLLLLSAGCAVERDLDWTYHIPDGVERANSHLIARIRQGGCRNADPILYEVDLRSTTGTSSSLPVLEQGKIYCFELQLEDETNCDRYAAVSTAVEVDNTVPVVVNQTLAALPTIIVCAAQCDDLGCRQCGEGLTFCPASGGASARCCIGVLTTVCDVAVSAACDPLE